MELTQDQIDAIKAEALREHLAKAGRSKSERKREAGRRNLERARAARWAKKLCDTPEEGDGEGQEHVVDSGG